MIRNYFKIAWRNLLRKKGISFINIMGLAAGLSCFLLIGFYIQDELSFDRYVPNSDRIFRINTDARMGGVETHIPLTSDMMAPLLKKDHPEIEEYTRIYTFGGSKLIKKNGVFIPEEKVANVDSTFFRVFDMPAVHGDPQTALNPPNTVVLTASAADKFYGTTDAVGKTLETQENGATVLYTVGAVIKDIPANSHFHFDMFFSMNSAGYQWGQIGNLNFYSYLLLRKGIDYHSVEAKLPDFLETYLLPYIFKRMNIHSKAEFERAGNQAKFTLIPLTQIHLYSDRPKELEPPGNIQYLYIFSAIAIFILAIACINFMNLATARSASRAREVGIRKVLGTVRRELIVQFLVESIITSGISLLLALIIACLLLPVFNSVAGKSMSLAALSSPLVILALLLLPILVGIMAGSYPAVYLSAFKPIEVLKGKLKIRGKSVGLRSILVVFQFATSIVLIVGTMVVYRQLHYIRNKDLGFNKEQLLIIGGADGLGSAATTFKDNVLQLPDVKSGTISSYLPVAKSFRSNPVVSKDPVADADNSFNMQSWSVDYDYLKTMGMEIVKGRGFSRDFGRDSFSVVINEATEKVLGYADPIGKTMYALEQGNKTVGYTIIGVVKNFNYESLRQNIAPLGLYLRPSSNFVSFRVNTERLGPLLDAIRDKWKAAAQSQPFTYHFLDESFDAMYRAEERMGTIILIFSVVAILIACLGMFGLAAFIAEQRTKEIGIRKVLGASVQGIVGLLVQYFLRLVFIAFLIAAPVAWWMMYKWLQEFAYRASIVWWIFPVAGGVALAIALLTISYQSVKAALTNPIKSLKAE